MAKISPALQLSAAQVDAIMTAQTRLRIATVGPAERLNLTPMTFGWAGGRVYIFGRGQKVANIRRNPTATVLVDTGEQWRELAGVMMQGSARILETEADETADEFLARAQVNLGRKHNLQRNGEPVAYNATASGKSRRWIVFTPRHVVTWDNSKLPGGDD